MSTTKAQLFSTEFKSFEMVEMWDKEFQNLVFKLSNDPKEDSNKQKNEVNKSMQNLNKKFNNLFKKFSKDTEILKSRKLGNEKLSKSNNAMEWCIGCCITSWLDLSKEYTEGKVEVLSHSLYNKENKNSQDLWNMTPKPNLEFVI